LATGVLRRRGRCARALRRTPGGRRHTAPVPGEILRSEPLVWVGLRGGVAAQREPLPLAVARDGCRWREMAMTALDRIGMDYRVVYMSEHCAGQEAALLADLAVAPFPASLVQAPLHILDEDAGLPPLGDYRIALVRRSGAGPASEVMADYIAEAFRELRH